MEGFQCFLTLNEYYSNDNFLQFPPANPDVLKKTLKLCMKSSEKLGLKHTVVTQDQSIYGISNTLCKENPEDFQN